MSKTERKKNSLMFGECNWLEKEEIRIGDMEIRSALPENKENVKLKLEIRRRQKRFDETLKLIVSGACDIAKDISDCARQSLRLVDKMSPKRMEKDKPAFAKHVRKIKGELKNLIITK